MRTCHSWSDSCLYTPLPVCKVKSSYQIILQCADVYECSTTLTLMCIASGIILESNRKLMTHKSMSMVSHIKYRTYKFAFCIGSRAENILVDKGQIGVVKDRIICSHIDKKPCKKWQNQTQSVCSAGIIYMRTRIKRNEKCVCDKQVTSFNFLTVPLL